MLKKITSLAVASMFALGACGPGDEQVYEDPAFEQQPASPAEFETAPEPVEPYPVDPAADTAAEVWDEGEIQEPAPPAEPTEPEAEPTENPDEPLEP